MARFQLSVLACLLGCHCLWGDPGLRSGELALLSGSQGRWLVPDGEEWQGAVLLWHPWRWLRCALELAEGQALRMDMSGCWWALQAGHGSPRGSRGGDCPSVLPAGSSSSMCGAQPCRQLICTSFISKAQKCVKSNPLSFLQLSGSSWKTITQDAT